MKLTELKPLAPAIDIADRLFKEIASRTRHAPRSDAPLTDAPLTDAPGADTGGQAQGVTRPSFGEGEQIAHDLVRKAALDHGLEVRADKVGCLHITLPGKNRNAPRIMIGSHLDSVPQGGDYDGTAGVLMGLAAQIGLARMGITPPSDIVTLAIRAEESAWFDASYIGSRSALGLLSLEDAQSIRRSDTRRSLADHMQEAGFDPAALDDATPAIDSATVGCFIEPHIEQGPVLIDQDVPLGLVTGIRGSFRYRDALCLGVYAHSGATPKGLRHDAVSATAALIEAGNRIWADLDAEGVDLVFTVGKLHTDAAADAFSKVSGQTAFTVDVRSLSTASLDRFEAAFLEAARDIADRQGVTFEFGPKTGSLPAAIDGGMLDRFDDLAKEMRIGVHRMASGAGHDAAIFAGAGIPTAMIFIRNANGSHNPDEAMEMTDFAEGARLLMGFCLTSSQPMPQG